MLKHAVLAAFLSTGLLSIAAIEDDAARKTRIAQLEAQRLKLDEALKTDPKQIALLTQRGDIRLFLGDAKGAIEDFEAEIASDPTREADHWRLGIAYHFAGEMERSAAQFAKYHRYDNRDRENGVWHYLATAKVKGVDQARQEMLKYSQFDREPFPALYEMFAGKRSAAEVLKEMEGKGLKDDPLVMFFAHYYVGLQEVWSGRINEGLQHLKTAVELARKAGARGGPGYMGEVARLHAEMFEKQATRPK